MYKFTKMHGCGNDYVYVYGAVEEPAEFAKTASDRHKGIGADGVVQILPSTVADARMRMFNADGSEGAMCGNAIRCVAKYLFDNQIVAKNPISIETKSGIKTIDYHPERSEATVAMGRARVLSKGFVTHVDVGNPHAVLFCNDVGAIDVHGIGAFIERSPYFVGGVNVEFVQIVSPTRIKMRVWERGSGETMACGTGSCASVVACIEHGFCKMDTDVAVELLGGELTIRVTDGGIFMTGGCTHVFSGVIE